MDKTDYRFKEEELKQIDQEVSKINEACERLSKFSRTKGGIPSIDRNLARISASLKNIATAGEVLEILCDEY